MRRGDLEPGGLRARRFFRKDIGARLASALIPVAVGIVLAIGWNWAGTSRPAANSPQSVHSPGVQVAVEQAAAQARPEATKPGATKAEACPRAPLAR